MNKHEDNLNNLFDIYGALYLLCTRWHSGQWSKGYRILSRLQALKYRPSPSLQHGHFESEEQREIYKRLYPIHKSL
jgi:hypothetical protein